MNNIAEGFARFNKKDFIRFLDYTKASSSEVKSMTYVLEDLELINKKEIDKLRDECDKVSSLTAGLIRYFKKSLECN
jgi:four helix bundle protein